MYLLLGVLAASLAAPVQAAASPRTPIKVGNWTGGAYVNDSGSFTHCAVSASYVGGTNLHVSVNRQMQWIMGFSNSNWKLKPGSLLPIKLVFQGHGFVDLQAEVRTADFFLFDMPETSAVIRAFRAASGMELQVLGKQFNFALTTTSRMLPTLVNCVRENTSAIARPQSPPRSEPVQAKADDEATTRLEAVTMATNFLLAMRLPDARVMKPGEVQGLTPASVAWKSPEASGTVQIVGVGKALKGVDVAADIASSDAKACGGKFATGRTAELVDNDVVFRSFSTCEDSSGSRHAEYYVVPRKGGGFVVFAVGSQAGVSATSSQVESRREIFQRAALKAIE